VTALDASTTFASFDEYWRPFLGGQGPAPAYVASLDGISRARLRDRIRERVPIRADGSISLIAGPGRFAGAWRRRSCPTGMDETWEIS